MIGQLCCVFLLIHSTLAQKALKSFKTSMKAATPTAPWLTLNGDAPLVVARGGFSGLFPDSSEFAYNFAKQISLPGVVLFCDIQMTKDKLAVCQSSLRLENSTTISNVFPKGEKTYNVNGQDMHGWFSLDYTLDTLVANISLAQNIFSRPSVFDGVFAMYSPDDIVKLKPPINLWLNVEYDMFYTQHKLSPASYIEGSAQFWTPSYISSPEIGFLKAMSDKVNKRKTKLIFKFLNADSVEPTTNEKYSSILRKLSTIKPFVSGILVPKEYIWPVTKNQYLEPATTLVVDAHKQGLEVYASGFANDVPLSYNYSYDPTAEYVKFIDDSQFSVDGVLTDFPATASESISCFAHKQNDTTKIMKALVISHNGASGDYPGCTDLAYQKAIDDGADIIDCSVQMSKDGVAFCLETTDLTRTTTAATSFVDRSSTVPEIQPKSGIFSFDLTWSEIQSLKPVIQNPLFESGLVRNPANKNKGKFVTLSEFLELAKTNAKIGVLISILNAPYLASKKGLGIVDAVTSALSNATLDKQSAQRVLIQSDDSSVLSKFKEVPTYQRVMLIKEEISDAAKPIVEEVKKYADAVTVTRSSIIKQDSGFFSTGYTNVTEEMHAANLSVYVETLRNEFVFLAFDYYADPYVELATMVEAKKVDGVITDFPATASEYMRNPCAGGNTKLQYHILPIQPGDLAGIIEPQALPPALAPSPPLEKSDVVNPPLPAVANLSTFNDSTSTSTPAAPSPKESSGPRNVANLGISRVAIMLVGLLAIRL